MQIHGDGYASKLSRAGTRDIACDVPACAEIHSIEWLDDAACGPSSARTSRDGTVRTICIRIDMDDECAAIRVKDA